MRKTAFASSSSANGRFVSAPASKGTAAAASGPAGKNTNARSNISQSRSTQPPRAPKTTGAAATASSSSSTAIPVSRTTLLSPALSAMRKDGVPYAAAVSHASSSSSAGAALGIAASDHALPPAASLPIGLPAIENELRLVFESEMSSAFGKEYQAVLAVKLPDNRNPIPGVDRKGREEATKKVVEDLRGALRHAISRRDAALAKARAMEGVIHSRFGAVAELHQQILEITGQKTAADAEVARLATELQKAVAAIALSKDNEALADEQKSEALEAATALDARVKELETSVREYARELEEQREVEIGLEADKSALREKLAKHDKLAKEAAEDTHRAHEKLRREVEQERAAAAASTAASQREAARLSADLRDAELRVKELERAASMGEVDVAKLRGEREAAALSRAALMEELDRAKSSTRQVESTYTQQIDTLRSTGEMQYKQIVELTAQVDSKQRRVEELQGERDALRESDAELKRGLRDAGRREEELSTKLAGAAEAAARLTADLFATQTERDRLSSTLASTRSSLEATLAEAARTKEDLSARLELASGKLLSAEEKLLVAGASLASWEAKATAWAEEKAASDAAAAASEETLADLTGQLATLRESAGASEESQLERLTQVSREADGLKRRVKDMGALRERLAAAEAEASKLREEAFGNEMARRALHNAVQELKGNIRVFVRVRPFLPGDGVSARAAGAAAEGGGRRLLASSSSSGYPEHIEHDEYEGEEEGENYDTGAPSFGPPAVVVAPDGTSLSIIPPPARGTKAGAPSSGASTAAAAREKPVSFAFDTVFGPTAGQADVFAEVSHLVQSALDGYNVCLFSYGQTGSGKTWTMVGGSPNDNATAGLIPRSVGQILEAAAHMGRGGWVYALEASFLEIYNETVRDLLRAAPPPGAADAPSLTVHQDGDANIEVPGLTRVPVGGSDAIGALLARAARRRAVASTAMNEQSSRSHSVFTLYIRGTHAARGVAVTGTLNLVDLAGSERLDRSGAEGDRKKETAAINKSLSCLADVFTALAQKKPHVPFRNSKLTHLLAPCFRGDGKTLMLVNLSPTPASAFESMCSLRFASQVSQVELGKAKKNVAAATTSGGASDGGGSGSRSAAAAPSAPSSSSSAAFAPGGRAAHHAVASAAVMFVDHSGFDDSGAVADEEADDDNEEDDEEGDGEDFAGDSMMTAVTTALRGGCDSGGLGGGGHDDDEPVAGRVGESAAAAAAAAAGGGVRRTFIKGTGAPPTGGRAASTASAAAAAGSRIGAQRLGGAGAAAAASSSSARAAVARPAPSSTPSSSLSVAGVKRPLAAAGGAAPSTLQTARQPIAQRSQVRPAPGAAAVGGGGGSTKKLRLESSSSSAVKR